MNSEHPDNDNSISPMGNDDALGELLSAMLDGHLSDKQEAQLDEMLGSDPEAQDRYIDQCFMHAMLRRELENPWSILAVDTALGVNNCPQPSMARGISGRLPSKVLALSGMLAAVGLLSLAASMVLVFFAMHTTAGPQMAGSQDQSHSPVSGGADSVLAGEAASGDETTSPAPGIGRLVRTFDCTWGKGVEPPKADRDLKAGQQLRLESGLVELAYAKGVNMVLQGPATMALGADNQVYLQEGRLTARLTDENARGFAVNTARSTIIDEGTEFGVDVAPGGDQNIHVFQGEVKLNVKDKTQSLKQDQAARVNAATQGVTLVKETGESFTRSIEHSGHDPHAVAYWRFEDHTVGNLVPDTSGSTAHIRGTIDSSGNGNDLFTWSPGSAPKFSDDVATESVPGAGRDKPNRSCLDNSNPPEQALTRDLYTRSWFSHASPLDIQQIAPERWTIECSVRAAQLHRGVQTFISRDINYPLKKPTGPQRLVFQIDGDDHFAVRFFDREHRMHGAIATRLSLVEKQWYHVAAVSDGKNLKLYVDSLDGRGYQIEAAAALPEAGSTALGKGDDAAAWLVGRGSNGQGTPVEWFCGWIDEVRISDIDRRPQDFLFTARATKAVATAANDIKL